MVVRSETYRDVVQAAVKLELVNGAVLLGTIEKARSKTVIELLNDTDAFLAVDCFDGTRHCIGKASIVACELRDLPKAESLASGLGKAEGYQPFGVLGVAQDADRETLRAAYVALARRYHPDRFNGIELPTEIATYVTEMAKRINVAYQDAKDLLGMADRKHAASAPAAWTKPARAQRG